MPTAYWWRGGGVLGYVPNLGDLLTPLLLQRFAGLDVTWSSAADADIVCCGSVLDALPRSGWTGIIAGSGQLQESTITDLTDATVLGVRGPLTLNRIKSTGTPVIGDPGLLAPMLHPSCNQKHEVGIVAHWSDFLLAPKELAKAEKYGYRATVIDIGGDPREVINAIGSCRKIVSSALHGIIVADAFGIPRRAEVFPAMRSNPNEGAFFKWDDWASSIGQPITFGKLQAAPTDRIKSMQHDLLAMFQQVKEHYAPAQSR